MLSIAHLSGGDDISLNPAGTLRGSCRRTRLRLVVCEGGFTQAWDTVGAGAIPTHVERARLRGALMAPAVRLSVSCVGHSARENAQL